MLGRIVSRLPDKIGTYYEPFLGGGAVFFELARERRFEKAVIGDLNDDLVNCYISVRDYVDGVVSELRRPKAYEYERENYLRIRAIDPASLSPVERAARMIFLNRTCFNGLYRVNRHGGFNVPFGRYKSPVICDERALRAASEVLRSVDIVCADFEQILKNAGRGDAVYLDPPYVPISETSSFTAYNGTGFGEEDHRRLAARFKELSESGAHVVLSNSSAPLALSLYDGFERTELMGSRSVGGPAEYRQSVMEIIVVSERISTMEREA